MLPLHRVVFLRPTPTDPNNYVDLVLGQINQERVLARYERAIELEAAVTARAEVEHALKLNPPPVKSPVGRELARLVAEHYRNAARDMAERGEPMDGVLMNFCACFLEFEAGIYKGPKDAPKDERPAGFLGPLYYPARAMAKNARRAFCAGAGQRSEHEDCIVYGLTASELERYSVRKAIRAHVDKSRREEG